MAKKITYKKYREMVEEQTQAMLDALAFAATGNLDVEIEIPEGIDVLTDLAIGFSYLIDDLKELISEQERARTELEQRVTERTQELERALTETRAVQQRYVREQWQSYATADSFNSFADSEEAWLPILSEAIEEKKIARYANGGDEHAIAFPIQYADELIGVLGFKEDDEIEWDEEDITAVEAVVEQVGLALENQRLFDQTQIALAETEALYQASAEINVAQTYDELLNALRQNTLLGDNSQNISINYFDVPWTAVQVPEWSIVLARWTQLPSEAVQSRYRLSSFPSLDKLLKVSEPTLIEDVATDRRLDDKVRALYTKQFGAASTIFVPLVASGQWIGYIDAIYQQPTEFPEVEVRQLMLLVAQAAVVAQTIRLLEETQGLLESEQRQRRIADLLVHAAERMTGVVDEQELHHIMVDEINGLIRPDQISLYVWSESERAFHLEQRILATKDHAEDDFKLKQWVVPDMNPDLWQAFQQKRSLLRTSQSGDEYLKEHYYLPWTISGQVAGVIEVYHTAKHLAIRDVDQRAAEGIVQQADLRIQNARLFTQTQLRADELSVLNEMSRDLTVSRDVDDVVENIYAYTNRLMDAYNFYVALHDRDNNVVNFPLAREQGKEITLVTRPFGEGATEYVIQTGQPLLIEDGVAKWLDAHNLDATNAVAKSWLGVPLKIGDEVLGAIAIRSSRSFVYDANQQNLLTSISSQAAIAIQNARLFNQAERRATELAILNQMGRDLTAVPDINHVLENTHAYTAQLMEARNFYVAIYDEPNQFVEFPFATEQGKKVRWRSRPFAKGMTEHVIQTGKPLLIEEDVEGWLKAEGIESIGSVAQSWLGVPMILGNEVLGVIVAQSRRARMYDHTHLNLLIAISSQAAIAIQNARLFAQTQEQLADLTTIQQATSDLTAALNMNDAIETLLPHLAQSVRADSADVFFFDDKNMNRVGAYPAPEPGTPAVSIPLASRPLVQEVIRTRQAVAIAVNDPDIEEHMQQALQKMGTSAIATIPLRSREGVQGVLAISTGQSGRVFTDNDISLLQTLADQATIAFERIRLLEEAERRARREQLLREITGRVRSSADVDMIMKTAVQEVGRALGRETFIRLGTEEKSRSS